MKKFAKTESSFVGKLTMSDERERYAAWITRGRGKGYRWGLLRGFVAVLAKQPLTSGQVKNVMSMYKGMTGATSLRFLEELKSSRCIEQFLENGKGYYWRATPRGVGVYLGSRMAIPATVAEELLSLVHVNESEA